MVLHFNPRVGQNIDLPTSLSFVFRKSAIAVNFYPFSLFSRFSWKIK